MERWYMGFATRIPPYELTDKLARLVRHYALDDLITRVCYERQAAHKRTREYYYFIGIVSDVMGGIPLEKQYSFQDMLKQLGMHDSQIHVHYDQIQSMASMEIEASSLRRIRMPQTNVYRPTDPFDSAKYSVAGSETSQDRSQAYEHLIHYLSAYGRGTWPQFRSICDALGIDTTGEYARRVLRSLRLLGHLELSRDGQNWFVAPPCLVRINSENSEYHAFFAGQRSPQLLKTLQREAYPICTSQPYGNAPDRVLVIFGNEYAACNFTVEYSKQHHPLNLPGQSGLTMAQILPSLEEWEATLPELSIAKGNYRFESWINGNFESTHLPQETGMYRLTHVSEHFKHLRLTLYFNAETETWKRADWYGIRFLTLRRKGIPCHAFYDSARCELAIELEYRWPDLYERSLVLASGLLPTVRNDRAVYANISYEHANLLADKLGAVLLF